MFRNYLTVAVRNLLRHKTYSVINILGLAVGMACCILIWLYVKHELSYDRFHENADRIYRVIGEARDGGKWSRWAITPSAYAPHMLQEFPEISSAVRIDTRRTPLLIYGSKRLRAENFVFADSSVFEVFSFPLLRGNPRTALKDPRSIVLTETAARSLFGDEDPLGRVITYDATYDRRVDFKVTGIAQEPPNNSSIRFDYLASFVSLRDMRRWMKNALEDYANVNYHTFLLLARQVHPGELEKKFPDYLKKYRGLEQSKSMRIVLQPITDIHLDTQTQFDFLGPKCDIDYIYTFSAISLFILLIACINSTNLSTARSARRTREVGIRKVAGAHRLQLIQQFSGESLSLSFVAMLLAIALAELFLPTFNDLAGRYLRLDYVDSPGMLLTFLGIWLFVGAASGGYPAFYLSSFQPASVLKGSNRIGAESALLRRMLIVIQFTISVVLIVGTVIVLEQFHFMKSRRLGFDKEHVVFMDLNRDLRKHYAAFKQGLLQNPHILRVSGAHGVPGRVITSQGYMWGSDGDQGASFWTIVVDPDYLETLGLELVAGRNFSWDIASDEPEAYILNEAAVRQLGWDSASAVGKEFKAWHRDMGHITGVVRDFHFTSLHQKIEPLVLRMEPGWLSMVAVRISPEDIPGTLSFVKQTWEEVSPEHPFAYRFLDTDFDRLYKAEEKLSKIFTYFSLLAIFIACLGAFGLASFATEQRTKEIGIRKALGASVPSILVLLCRELAGLVLLANVIAWPIAYFAMNKWLQNFAYRTQIQWWAFALAGSIALVIALATVSFQAIRAATANPVDALRYE